MKSSRREFLMLAAAGTAALGGCARFRRYSQDNNRPNTIMMTADDLGWKDLKGKGNRAMRKFLIDEHIPAKTWEAP